MRAAHCRSAPASVAGAAIHALHLSKRLQPLDQPLSHLTLRGVGVTLGEFKLGPVTLEYIGPQIISLVGPNGSGKSTLIQCMLGLQHADSGVMEWRGADLTRRDPEVLVEIGHLSDSPEDLLPELTASEYWEFCALAYSRQGRHPKPLLDQAGRVTRALDFSPPNRAIASFSLGMRRKTQLVGALMHQPALIILDEPLVGLDFMAVRALERVLAEERERGATVLISSHDLDLAQRLADQVILLHNGRLLLADAIDSVAADGAFDTEIERAIQRSRLEFA
jgi:ABC-2 type transport system ATP-binding protein